MFRLGLSSLKASRGCALAAAVPLTYTRRANGSAGPPPKAAPVPEAQSPTAAEAKPEEPKANAPKPLGTDDVLRAVKSGDINKMQDTATRLVQSRWKEEYTLPAACVVVFIILWYWVAWTRRSVRRKCAAAEAAARQEAQETVDMVRNLTQKWTKDLAKSDEQMKAIIEKNSTLTADIDRMTTALRSCSIRPTPTMSTSAARVKVVDVTGVTPELPSTPEPPAAVDEAPAATATPAEASSSVKTE